jgi:malate dehydrogenase (oxaloacetate-decarboxylating)(NADP+)
MPCEFGGNSPAQLAPACAAHVAAAVANKAYNVGVATELPRPHDLLDRAYSWMYNPRYKRYR